MHALLTFPQRIALLGALLAGLFFSAPALAQSYSVEEDLLEADWHEEAVAEGVVWRSTHLDGLFGLPQSLNVLDVDLDVEGVTIDIVSSDTGRVKTSTLARAAGAVAAATDDFNVTHHPRTALGITPDDHLLLVTVDGRATEAAGMTIRELAWVMQGLGCTMALNLDGGGSTTMWIEGEGVVNYPSDNGGFDHAGERAVANAIVVRVGH